MRIPGDTSSIKELNAHICHMSSIIKSQDNLILHIKTNNGNEDPSDSGDDKSVLNIPNKENTDLRRQGQVSAKSENCGW